MIRRSSAASLVRSPLVALCLVLPLSAPRVVLAQPAGARAAATGTVTGTVARRGGGPLEGAVVEILDHGLRTVTDASGSFSFDSVPAGRHVLHVEHLGMASSARTFDMQPGAAVSLQLALEPFHVEETVVVSSAAGPRASDDLVEPASTLSGLDLLAAARPSLGETLEALPGVSSTSFGPGASRPLVRGLGGDRVRVATNGLDAGDASTASPDHAPAVSALQAERIEVLRGPATLRWGSSAIGGVVNVIDTRLPAQVPDTPVTGVAQLLGGTNADETAGSVTLDGGGKQVAWHLDAHARDASDIDTPEGRLENSWTDGRGAAVGVGWIGDRGRVAAAVSDLRTQYGSPADEEISIDLEQQRWDVEGEVRRAQGAFRGLTVRAGGSDYEHVELEGGETGTRFTSDVVEARVEGRHAARGRHEGAFGVQWTGRDFAAVGEEAFVPPSETQTLGMFAFQEARLSDAWTLQAGARWERRTVDAKEAGERDFSGFSASAGILRSDETGLGFSASLSRSTKLPTAEELFSDGPHAATGAYEIGDPLLEEEVGTGLDVGVRKKAEWWSVALNLFYQSFDGFILEAPTGEVEDDLPVFRFTQGDAELRGGELTAEIGLNRDESHHVRLEVALEHVRGDGEDSPLPRIPPFTGSLGVRYDGTRAWALLRGTWVAEQDRVAPHETETDGFAFLDAQAGWRILTERTVHDIVLSATNLTDELGRRHASFTKDVAPLPGRGATLSYRITF